MRYTPNPKWRVKLTDAEGGPITDVLFGDVFAKSSMLEHWEEIGIPLSPSHRPNELAFFGSRGRPRLWLKPISRTIYFWLDPASLELAWVLKQLAELEELEDFELVQRLQGDECWTPGGGYDEWCGQPLGMTLGQYVAALQPVSVELPSRQRFRQAELTPEHYEYYALKHPYDIEWYHATAAANVESIQRHGLRPSQVGQAGGWSPAWNLNLQNLVYLTADYDHACDIAETIALRQRTNAVVLAVAPGALEDLSRLRIDEDAAEDQHSDGPTMGLVDPDFPEWETSWHGYRHQTIAYAGVIPPEYLRVVGVGEYREETYERPSGEIEIEPEFEWTDLEAD